MSERRAVWRVAASPTSRREARCWRCDQLLALQGYGRDVVSLAWAERLPRTVDGLPVYGEPLRPDGSPRRRSRGTRAAALPLLVYCPDRGTCGQLQRIE